LKKKEDRKERKEKGRHKKKTFDVQRPRREHSSVSITVIINLQGPKTIGISSLKKLKGILGAECRSQDLVLKRVGGN